MATVSPEAPLVLSHAVESLSVRNPIDSNEQRCQRCQSPQSHLQSAEHRSRGPAKGLKARQSFTRWMPLKCMISFVSPLMACPKEPRSLGLLHSRPLRSQLVFTVVLPCSFPFCRRLIGGAHSAMQFFRKFPSVGLRCGSGQAPYECEERNWTIRGFSLQGVEPQMGGSGELWPHPFSTN